MLTLRPLPLALAACTLLVSHSALADSVGFQMRTPGYVRALRAAPERAPHFLVTPPVVIASARPTPLTAIIGRDTTPFGAGGGGQVPTVLQQVNDGVQTVAAGDNSTAITFIQVLQQQIVGDAASAAAAAAQQAQEALPVSK